MRKIKRKTLLYKTGVEYGDYTINHAEGCYHGCLYPCYAFMMAKRFGRVKSYEDWIDPKIVSNALSILEKEIPKFIKKIKSVHLSFTTDPFMAGYPEISELSIDIIKLLNSHDIKCTVLTKSILPIELSNTLKKNEFGITLISLNEEFRKRMEPNSKPYLDRIKSLKYLHDKGFQTWVSIEPYPTPNIIEQDLNDILESISFVDKIIFGRLHYNKLVSAYKGYQVYYNSLSKQVIEFCTLNSIRFHIKDKTVVYK